MGDHGDLPNCSQFLQLRRLQKQSQPLEQLDEVIEKIRRADDQVSRDCQQGEEQRRSRSSSNNATRKEMEQGDNSRR
jgi:hypothetical protein